MKNLEIKVKVENLKEHYDEHEEIKQKLALNKYKTVAGSYSDLLWQKKLSHSP